jgi:hypothetical protein
VTAFPVRSPWNEAGRAETAITHLYVLDADGGQFRPAEGAREADEIGLPARFLNLDKDPRVFCMESHKPSTRMVAPADFLVPSLTRGQPTPPLAWSSATQETAS